MWLVKWVGAQIGEWMGGVIARWVGKLMGSQ